MRIVEAQMPTRAEKGEKGDFYLDGDREEKNGEEIGEGGRGRSVDR